jgi:hypothetical protein
VLKSMPWFPNICTEVSGDRIERSCKDADR